MVQTANTIWRDFVTSGVPSSGVNDPDKADIRQWGTWVETIFTAVITAGGKLYASKAAMDADTAPAINTPAIVLGDATAANNGLYRKSAAAGTAGWTRAGDVPGYSYITATNAGAGTANAIQATTSIPVPAGVGGALVVVPIVADNTGPATIRFNNELSIPMVTSSGTALAAGYLKAGMLVAGYRDADGNFRLLSDVPSAAIQAAAEEARDDAAGSAAAAAASAAGLSLPAIQAGDAGKQLFVNDDDSGYNLIKPVERPLLDAKALAYDMHFRVLRGRGWMTGEAGGNVDYELQSAASAGDRSITLTAASAKPITAQLIVYRGVDLEYYTAVVNSVAGNVVSLMSPLEVGIDAGLNAHNFYINESHPNFWGYQAIADDLIRARVGSWKQVHKESPSVYAGTSAVVAFTSDNAANPGSSAGGGWQVTPNVADGACQWVRFRPKKTGRYRAVFKCNRGGGDGTQTLDFNVLINGAFQYTVPIETSDVSQQYVDFSVMDGNAVEFRLSKSQTFAFFVSDLVILEREPQVFDGFETGRHLVFGDSWAAISTDDGVPGDFGIIDRLRERFPFATFVNKGVGGNTAAMLVARFDTDIADDIAANGPVKSMLVIDGTNDFFSSHTPTEVGDNLGIIAAKTLALGVTPIFFTSSVGSYTESTARFALSRRYATEIALIEKDMGYWQEFTPAVAGTTSAGGGTYTIQEGRWRREGNRVDFAINLGWSAHSGTGNMKITGMPLPAAELSYPCSVVYSGLTYTSQPQAYVTSAGEIFLGQAASGGSIAALPMDAAVSALFVSGSYFV